MGCVPITSLGTRVHVAAGATGTQTGSAAQPYASIEAALAAAALINESTLIVIAAGTYDIANVTLTGQEHLIGGVDATFTCLVDAPTILRSSMPSQPAIRTSFAPLVELEHLTIVGNPDAANTPSRGALYVSHSHVILRQVRIESQRDLDATKQTAMGIEVEAAFIEVFDSTVIAGKAYFGATAIASCSSDVWLERVTIENRNTLPGPAIGVHLGLCDTLLPSTGRIFQSTIAVTSEWGTGVSLGGGSSTLQVRNSAIVAAGAAARALFLEFAASAPQSIAITLSTLVGGKVVVEGYNQLALPLLLQNSILAGPVIFHTQTWDDLMLTLGGTSILHSPIGTMQTMPWAPDLPRDAAAFRAVYDSDFATNPNLRFDDPLLDGFHLSASSPAKNGAACSVDYLLDVDGEIRGTLCDIGADELP